MVLETFPFNISGADVTNTPAGDISATDLQGAIDELDSEKVAKAGDSMTGNLALGNASEVRFNDADDSDYVGFVSPAVLSGTQLWTLPDGDGTSGQVLQTDGAGTLSWTTPLAGDITSVTASSGLAVVVLLVT